MGHVGHVGEVKNRYRILVLKLTESCTSTGAYFEVDGKKMDCKQDGG